MEGNEENTASMFESDVILPDQYWDSLVSKGPLQPETRLMLAILEDAIECFRKEMRTRGRKFREAREWFLEEDSDWPFSFENICDLLGLSASAIRQRLMHYKEKKPAGPSKAQIYIFPVPTEISEPTMAVAGTQG